MPKINFIIHFFLVILHVKESCSLIGQQHFGPQLENHDFARCGTGGEISITLLVFILNYFQEKLMTKLFKKTKKPFIEQWSNKVVHSYLSKPVVFILPNRAIVCTGVLPPPSKTPPFLFYQAPLINLLTVQALPFRQAPPAYLFFVNPP